MSPRTRKALQNFASGDNCAQSVFKAYADLLGLTEHQAGLLSAGFGGGIGRLRNNCGAFSAAVMLCGWFNGDNGGCKEMRREVYSTVQAVYAEFVQQFGTINCAELLGKSAGIEPPTPDKRTSAYYFSRPCSRIIRKACGIIESHMISEEKQ